MLKSLRKSMRLRMLLYSIVIVLVSVAVSSGVSVVMIVNDYLNEKKNVLADVCVLLGGEIALEREAGIDIPFDEYAERYYAATGFRVTFINHDGEVLADSRSRENIVYMDNHSDRVEVVAALEYGSGSAQRRSESFGRDYLYSALRQELPGGEVIVVRLAMEVDKNRIAAEHGRSMAPVSVLIGIVIGTALAILYMRQITTPIRELEKQLAETIEKTRKAENIRKEFVTNVTHELKTPLTSISGFAETLQGSAGDKPEVRERFLEIISLESARLARLIDDTLIISDIENGRDHMSRDDDIDVRQAIEEVIDTLSPMAESEEVALSFNCQYNMIIGGDEGRFKQLLYNLIENAIKYSGDGKQVFVNAGKEGDGRVCVSVRDEGIGIAEADVERIFERFYRVDKSRSRDAGGTGLGLAIVKHIATLFDAELSVESKPGQGSVFLIRFPVD